MATLGGISIDVISERHNLRQDVDAFSLPNSQSSSTQLISYSGVIRTIEITIIITGEDENELASNIEKIEALQDGGNTTHTYTNQLNKSYNVIIENISWDLDIQTHGQHATRMTIRMVEGV